MTNEQIRSYQSVIVSAIKNEPMSKHTSFHIGGPARLYAVAHSSDALWQAVQAAQKFDIPWYVFGGGTNLLVADAGFDGVMIQAANRGVEINDTTVKLESGVITVSAARKIVDAGLAGFEWAVGVPGTIGGAIYGDAGCYGGEMREVITSVDAYRVADGQRVTLTNQECQFGYRESLFKHEAYVIFGCALHLKEASDQAESQARLHQVMEKRKADQPQGSSSAGCAFKNFEFQDEKELEILRRTVDVIPASMLRNKRISAGWLIEQANMKGRRVGGVEVSMKHGNFLLTTSTARAQDVVALISLVKMNVRDTLGIELQEEVQYVGF
ncbi:UDP-N-acetylmuramate dehydrogenase [Candidatus Uhrbacteria bacterium]|nr:UDP-N-acetylmuramate dehydrogenase [Candidatus Uhrbacteria bacterium]